MSDFPEKYFKPIKLIFFINKIAEEYRENGSIKPDVPPDKLDGLQVSKCEIWRCELFKPL